MYDNQVTSQPVPDLDDPGQRSASLLRYCTKLHGSGDLQLAAAMCNRSHEIDPTDPEPLLELASVMQDLRMSDSAAEAYRAVLLLDPQRVDALYGLGKVHIEARRYEMAVQSLETALLVDANDPRIYNALGIVMDQRGDHVTAQAYYRRGLDQSPRNIPIRNNLGLSLVLAGDREAGLAMLRDVAAETGADPTASLNLAMASQAQLPAPSPEPQEITRARPHPLRPHPEAAEAPGTAEVAAMADADLADSAASPGTPPDTAPTRTETASRTPVSVLRSYGSGSDDLDMGALAPQVEDLDPAPQPLERPAPGPERSAEVSSDQSATADDVVIASSARDGRAPASPFRTAVTQLSAAPAPAAEESTTPTPAYSAALVEDRNDAEPAVSIEPAAAPETAADEGIAPRPAYNATALVEDRNDFEPAMSIEQTAAREAGSPDDPSQEPRRSMPIPLTVASETPADQDEGQDQIDDGDWFYTVQLGAYRSPDAARGAWDVAADAAGDLLAGLDAVIVRADLGIEQGIVYRVRTEPMADHGTAQQLCDQLQAEGVDCFAVKASHSVTEAATVDRICPTGADCAARKPEPLESTGLPYNPGPAG